MKTLGYMFFGLLLATTAFAQVDTSEFTIRLFTGEDTESPTTPSLLSVTPVATTQIDVVWSAATDNFVVGGYVVFRDGSAVATTTLTNFSDSGLTPSTTYSYFVQAFDAAGNYSSSSNLIATTTLAVPPPVVPPVTDTGSQTGTASRVVLDDFQITRGTTTAIFSIATARPARFEIRFGRTTSYELGYSVTETFTREYRTVLSSLEPGTVYQYEVVGYSAFGVPSVLRRGQFTTLGNEQLFAPENVTRLEAVAEGDDVLLKWQLPSRSDLSTVRVVRSHLGFPTTIQDGAVVYQGQGTTFRDQGIFTLYSPVYYTVFVLDGESRSSSGAVAVVYALDLSEQNETNGSNPSPDIAAPPIEEVSEIERLLPEFRMPLPEEIFVIQQNKTHTFGASDVRLAASEPIVFSIPKTAVAKNLKTIVATLTDPVDGRKTFSFLLRINNTDTAYEATLAPLLVSGQSQLTITIYDYEARVVGTRSQVLTFIESRSKTPAVFWPDYFVTQYKQVLAGLGGFLLLSLCLWFWRKSRR